MTTVTATEWAETVGGGLRDDAEARVIAVQNFQVYKESGIQVMRGWDRNSPFTVIDHEAESRFGEDVWFVPGGGLVDHPYRLLKDGQTTYVSEPYGVDDFAALAKLQQDGWCVRIGQLPLWYPGRTTQILFSGAVND